MVVQAGFELSTPQFAFLDPFDSDSHGPSIHGSDPLFWSRQASGSQASLNFYRVDDETAMFARHDAFSNETLEALAHFRP